MPGTHTPAGARHAHPCGGAERTGASGLLPLAHARGGGGVLVGDRTDADVRAVDPRKGPAVRAGHRPPPALSWWTTARPTCSTSRARAGDGEAQVCRVALRRGTPCGRRGEGAATGRAGP
ncbi:hypothetical protein GCM10010524_25320 [Streptomyces mexicanus]